MIFQPAQLAFFWCEFCFWFVFIRPREVKRVNDGGRWQGGEREFFSLASSPPLLPPPPPCPLPHHFLVRPRFWLSHSCISYFTNHKRRSTNTKKPPRQLLERCGWINLYLVDNAIDFPHSYPLDSDLSDGQRYSTFKQPEPAMQANYNISKTQIGLMLSSN